MNRQRWMAVFFAAGSTCFLIGPFPGYAQLVGDTADAITFFVGSILFTAGGTLQTSLAVAGRQESPAGRGSMLNLAAANWNTALGAACFLTCALGTLMTGETLKVRQRASLSLWPRRESRADAGSLPQRAPAAPSGRSRRG